MPILTIIIVLILVGILLWFVNVWIPMDPKVKQILNVVVIIVLVVWLFKVFGLWALLSGARI